MRLRNRPGQRRSVRHRGRTDRQRRGLSGRGRHQGTRTRSRHRGRSAVSGSYEESGQGSGDAPRGGSPAIWDPGTIHGEPETMNQRKSNGASSLIGAPRQKPSKEISSLGLKRLTVGASRMASAYATAPRSPAFARKVVVVTGVTLGPPKALSSGSERSGWHASAVQGGRDRLLLGPLGLTDHQEDGPVSNRDEPLRKQAQSRKAPPRL